VNATRIDSARLGRRRRRATRRGAGEGIRFFDLPDCLVRARIVAGHPSTSPTIVIYPDAPGTIEHYGELFDLLTPSVNVVCIEAVGSGFSFPKRGYDFTLERGVAAMGSVLRQIDLGPYVVIAPCGGAYGAIRSAATDPDLVSGLAIVQAPSWAEEKRWINRIDSAGVISRPLLGQAICAAAPGKLSDRWFRAALGPEAELAGIQARSREVLRRGGCFCLASNIQANRGAEFPLDVVSQPTLIVWGTADPTHRRTDRRSSLAYAPQARYVEFEDAGHCPDLEQGRRFSRLALELVESAATSTEP
jgi:pimeloyl-ACP methyl ester carboxylesterase